MSEPAPAFLPDRTTSERLHFITLHRAPAPAPAKPVCVKALLLLPWLRMLDAMCNLQAVKIAHCSQHRLLKEHFPNHQLIRTSESCSSTPVRKEDLSVFLSCVITRQEQQHYCCCLDRTALRVKPCYPCADPCCFSATVMHADASVSTLMPGFSKVEISSGSLRFVTAENPITLCTVARKCSRYLVSLTSFHQYSARCHQCQWLF